MKEDNKRIAKNTLFLYCRIFILMVITFYSSRLLLQALGVEDYGIYNVIGSIVALFASLKGLLASSMQRFLNYELGLNNGLGLIKIFNMGLLIHILICICFFIVAEIIGNWFIHNKIVVSEDKMNIVYYIFHLSVVTAMITIINIPFLALIMAHEKMNVFAYLSVCDGVLKLVAIYLLVYTNEKLLSYAVLVLFITAIGCCVNMIYCKKKFNECQYRILWDKSLFCNMISFSCWQFLGNSSFAIQQQGANMLLNVFFGPALNAARGVVFQGNSAITSFISNMMLAINPQITKLYAQKRKEELLRIFFFSSKIVVAFFILFSCPIFFYTDECLRFWLGTPPEYSVIFFKIMILYSIVRVLHMPIDSVFKAVGRIKYYMLIDSIMLSLNIPLAYLAFKFGASPVSMFVIMIIVEFFNLMAISVLCSKSLDFSYLLYFYKVLFPSCIVGIIGVIGFLIFHFFNMGFYALVSTIIMMSWAIWFFVLSADERAICFSIINKLRKK